MISWIQRNFQQHFKWLFLALLAVVIISFVFITNASSGMGQVSKQTPSRLFFGVNLGSPEESQQLMKDATLSVQLHGLQIRSENQFQQYALQRRAAIHLASELNLPAPTEAQIVAQVQTLKVFTGADGQFDAKRYAEFRDSLKTNPQIKEADVSRVIADDVTYNQVLKLLSGPGYVLPADVQNQLNRIDATWTLEAVTVDYNGFKPTLTVTDEALAQFFDYNGDRYEIGAKVGVSYIDFPASAFTDRVPAPSEEGLQAYYEANKARFAKDGADFAAARAQVTLAYKLERARTLAVSAASDFAVALFNANVTPATLDAFLASRQLSAKRVAPFNTESVPAELGGRSQVAVAALKTDAAHPFSDPVDTGRGAALLVWNESVPARKPALAEIKDRVSVDFLESEKRKSFAEAGRTLRTALEARLKAGDTLEKAVAASASVIPSKLTTKSWPAFTLTTPPQDLDYSVYTAIDGLNKGELSQMISSGEQGLIVYAADKKLPAADTTSAKFTDTKSRIAAYTASRNGGAVLAALVETELAKTAPAT
ncbi:MAG: peptidyl-prolyl cis-trans isomerase, partial [Opitutaceae bacterium]|nr:peptidyl-prolyl cis-trans isomerase [Opitutaceae bacterium]